MCVAHEPRVSARSQRKRANRRDASRKVHIFCDTNFRDARGNVFARHRRREGEVLQFLAHTRGLECRESIRTNLGAGDEKSREFIDGEQMHRHRAVAQRSRVGSVRENRVEDLFIDTVLAQVRDGDMRMLGLGGMTFPIEIVQQSREHPSLAIAWIKFVGIRAHARGDAFHVMAQARIAHPLMQEVACFVDVHAVDLTMIAK